MKEAEVGGMWLQFKDTLDQLRERPRKDPPLEPVGRKLALLTPELQTPGLQSPIL